MLSKALSLRLGFIAFWWTNMNYRSLFLLGVIISLFSSQSLKAQGPLLKYPSTKKIEQVDIHHGTKVADP
jgi:hypothetical protein